MLINITPNSKVICCMHASGEITDDPVKWSNTTSQPSKVRDEKWESKGQKVRWTVAYSNSILKKIMRGQTLVNNFSIQVKIIDVKRLSLTTSFLGAFFGGTLEIDGSHFWSTVRIPMEWNTEKTFKNRMWNLTGITTTYQICQFKYLWASFSCLKHQAFFFFFKIRISSCTFFWMIYQRSW